MNHNNPKNENVIGSEEEDEEKDVVVIMAVSPTGSLVASLVSAPPRRIHPNDHDDSKNNHKNDNTDTMVMMTIRSIHHHPPNKMTTVSPSISTTTTTSTTTTIRIPSISSYLASSSLSSKLPTSYTVRRRQLIWLGGSIQNSSTATATTATAMRTDTPYIGLITTLQSSPSATATSSMEDNPSAVTTTMTFLTVVDRTRGIPIYTMQCDVIAGTDAIGSGTSSTGDTTSMTPFLIHDATNTTATTKSISNEHRNKRMSTGSSSSAPADGMDRTTCIGIFQRSLSSVSNHHHPLFYIASARHKIHTHTTSPQEQEEEVEKKDPHHPDSKAIVTLPEPKSPQKVPVLLYECQIATGKILRKIKLGHSDSFHNGRDDSDLSIIHQPWLSILDATTTTTSLTSPATSTSNSIPTSIMTYVLGPQNTCSSTPNSSHPSAPILKGMNLMDGSKLYKVKLPSHPLSLTTSSSHEKVSTSTVVVAMVASTTTTGATTAPSSSSSLPNVAITVTLDPLNTIRLFDTVTGRPIVAAHTSDSVDHHHNKNDRIVVTLLKNTNNNSEQDTTIVNQSRLRLQAVLSNVSVPTDSTMDTPITPSKKSKKAKTKNHSTNIVTTAASDGISATQQQQYWIWIVVDEQTVIPIQIQKLESNTSTSQYGYIVQSQYHIAATKTNTTNKHDRMMMTMMRCCLMSLHPNHHNHNITKHPTSIPHLMVFRQSQLQTTTSSKGLNVQTIPLLPNMDVDKDHMIRIVFDETPQDHTNQSIMEDHRTIMMNEDHDDDDMDVNVDTTLKRDGLSQDLTKKRKQSVSTVLGPGQSGGEARHVIEADEDNRVKRMKRSNDDNDDEDDDENENVGNEPTIAERLRLLQQALDAEDDDDDDDNEKDETLVDDNNDAMMDDANGIVSPRHTGKNDNKFVVKHATTESLTQLLIQALQSADGTMLEQAFQVRDKDILRTTCRALSSEQVLVLFDALIQRLANKPNRAEQLVAWVSAILQSNQITNVQHLQPLQNLLSERLEVFPLLLQLEGRLENMIGM